MSSVWSFQLHQMVLFTWLEAAESFRILASIKAELEILRAALKTTQVHSDVLRVRKQKMTFYVIQKLFIVTVSTSLISAMLASSLTQVPSTVHGKNSINSSRKNYIYEEF